MRLRNAHSTKVLLMLLLLTPPAVVQGQFRFTTNNGALTITGYTGTNVVVVIPGTTNGLPVTSIGTNAFLEHESRGLTSVTIPDSVTNIGSSAFYSCRSLTNATIGTNVTNIGTSAFYQCTSLTSIVIPASVTSIGGTAFYFCTNLTAITVDTNNPAYSSDAGVLLDKEQTTLIQCPAGKTGTYTVPSSVTNIGYQAFMYCGSLTNVAIGNGFTSIGSYAFAYCRNLTSVAIGTNATSIGNYALFYCTSLTSITIPNSVTSIGTYAFSDCPSLTNVTIGSGVTNIGNNALTFCSNLATIKVDTNNPAYASVDGVLFNKGQNTLIQYPEAKAGTYTIPSGVTSIGTKAFYFCTSLTNVMIPSGVATIGPQAFCFCTSLGKVTIPNSVTSIGSGAFQSCYSLTNVTLGNSVTNVASFAFANCFKLTTVYFAGNAPDADSTLFYYLTNTTTVYYLPGTTGWSTNFSGRPTELWRPQVQASDASFGVWTNQFGFSVAWASGMVVAVEACTNLANPVWFPVGTNTLSGGTSYFSDPQWTNYPARFYRLRWP